MDAKQLDEIPAIGADDAYQALQWNYTEAFPDADDVTLDKLRAMDELRSRLSMLDGTVSFVDHLQYTIKVAHLAQTIVIDTAVKSAIPCFWWEFDGVQCNCIWFEVVCHTVAVARRFIMQTFDVEKTPEDAESPVVLTTGTWERQKQFAISVIGLLRFCDEVVFSLWRASTSVFRIMTGYGRSAIRNLVSLCDAYLAWCMRNLARGGAAADTTVTVSNTHEAKRRYALTSTAFHHLQNWSSREIAFIVPGGFSYSPQPNPCRQPHDMSTKDVSRRERNKLTVFYHPLFERFGDGSQEAHTLLANAPIMPPGLGSTNVNFDAKKMKIATWPQAVHLLMLLDRAEVALCSGATADAIAIIRAARRNGAPRFIGKEWDNMQSSVYGHQIPASVGSIFATPTLKSLAVQRTSEGAIEHVFVDDSLLFVLDRWKHKTAQDRYQDSIKAKLGISASSSAQRNGGIGFEQF